MSLDEEKVINIIFDARGAKIHIPQDVAFRIESVKTLYQHKKLNEPFFLDFEASEVHNFFNMVSGSNYLDTPILKNIADFLVYPYTSSDKFNPAKFRIPSNNLEGYRVRVWVYYNGGSSYGTCNFEYGNLAFNFQWELNFYGANRQLLLGFPIPSLNQNTRLTYRPIDEVNLEMIAIPGHDSFLMQALRDFVLSDWDQMDKIPQTVERLFEKLFTKLHMYRFL